MAKPEGIRKVIAEQSLEGAIIHLFDLIQEVKALVESYKPLPVVNEPVLPEEGA